jgi:hypothetical protein
LVQVRTLFEHMATLHAPSFDTVVAAVEGLKFELGGRVVIDVDRAIAVLVREYQAVRGALRSESASLFTAGDVNDDGVLSFDEFKEVVRVVMPSVSGDDKRCWLVRQLRYSNFGR